MSYYLLTPVSNFNKILALGSISPAALFPKRRSGFQSFDIASGEPDSVMRLYEVQPNLVPSNEDGPVMAIKIPEESVTPIRDEGGLLWSRCTIQLAPTNKYSLVFNSDKELEEAFNATRMSLEAKFSDRYRRIAMVAKQAGGRKQEKNKTLPLKFAEEDFESLFLQNYKFEITADDVERFETVDRFKGALYCYCLDKNLAVPKALQKDYVECMQLADDLVNVSTQRDYSRLSELRANLESLLFTIACDRVKENEEHNRCARREGGDPDATSFDLASEVSLLHKLAAVNLPNSWEGDGRGLDDYRDCLESRIRSLFGTQKKGKLPQVTKMGNMLTLEISESHGALAEYFINSLISTSLYAECGKRLGAQFALEGGKMIAEFFGDRWQRTRERDYINALLNHLNGSKSFDPDDRKGIEDEDNFQFVRAFALLSSRDDNRDLDSFYRYLLVKRGVTDFKLPFALWGAVFGFSQISKTLCDNMPEGTYASVRKLFAKSIALLNAGQDEIGIR